MSDGDVSVKGGAKGIAYLRPRRITTRVKSPPEAQFCPPLDIAWPAAAPVVVAPLEPLEWEPTGRVYDFRLSEGGLRVSYA